MKYKVEIERMARLYDVVEVEAEDVDGARRAAFSVARDPNVQKNWQEFESDYHVLSIEEDE